MTMDAKTIILEYVCPTVGVLITIQMFAAPFRDVQSAIARGSLGDLNPLPWIFMLGNCCGWIIYSYLIQNFFVFTANMPGFFLAVWFNLAASKLLFRGQEQAMLAQVHKNDNDKGAQGLMTPQVVRGDDVEKEVASDSSTEVPPSESMPTTRAVDHPSFSHETVFRPPNHDFCVMGMVVFWATIISILGFANELPSDTRELMIGSITNLNLVFFYGAPLSTIATILRTRNTSTLHVRTMVTNTVNGIFWATYGFAILDYFVFVPNGLGALLGIIQIILYFIFPREKSAAATGKGLDAHKKSHANGAVEDEETGALDLSELEQPVETTA